MGGSGVEGSARGWLSVLWKVLQELVQQRDPCTE